MAPKTPAIASVLKESGSGQLPAVHRDLTLIEHVIGAEAARRLADAFGGRRLYVPKVLKPDHPILRAIGAEAARLLVEEFGGLAAIDVPVMPDRRARIVQLDGEGWSRAAVAIEVGVTERRVYQVLRDERAARTTGLEKQCRRAK